MMQCCQCPKPAMFQVGDGNAPLCLDCYTKLVHALDVENAANERMLNYLSDEMAFIAGVGPIGPRYPERRPSVQIKGGTFNSINVSRSNVGVINTGNLHQVDTAVSVIAGSGDKQLAALLKTLTELVISHQGLTPEQQNEAVELLGALASEGAEPRPKRRAGVARALVGRLREVLSVSADLATVMQSAAPLLMTWFG